MARALGLGIVVVALSACSSTPALDGGPDAPAEVDAPTISSDVRGPDAPDTSADAICPAYDAHARECFGEGTGEDFLAECRAIYDGCGGSYPAVVRCRLETPCADLGACTGLGC